MLKQLLSRKNFQSFMILIITMYIGLFLFSNVVFADESKENPKTTEGIEILLPEEEDFDTYVNDEGTTVIIPKVEKNVLLKDTPSISFSNDSSLLNKNGTFKTKSLNNFKPKFIGGTRRPLSSMFSLGCTVRNVNDSVYIDVNVVRGVYIVVYVYKDGNYWTHYQVNDGNNTFWGASTYTQGFGNAGPGTYTAIVQYYYPSCFYYLDGLYQNAFDRNADWDGFYHWFDVLRGVSVIPVTYLQWYNYGEIDDGTANYWMEIGGGLDATTYYLQTPAQSTAAGFCLSDEMMRTRYTNNPNYYYDSLGENPRNNNVWNDAEWKRRIDLIYRTALFRGGDAGGIANWNACAYLNCKVWRTSPHLNNSRYILNFLTVGMINNQEFNNLQNNAYFGLSNGRWNGAWERQDIGSWNSAFVGHICKVDTYLEDENGNITYWHTPINAYYTNGTPISWNYPADAAWQGLSYSTTMGMSNIAETRIMYRQRYLQNVQVRYQNADGTWGNYTNAINTNYRYGQRTYWSYTEDDKYNTANVDYITYGSNTTKVDVSRKQYRQVIYVRYQNVDGTWGEYEPVLDENRYYEQGTSWHREADATYNEAGVSYTVYGANTKYVDVSRKQYTVTLDKDENVSSVSGGGTYYAGASVTISATLPTGYDLDKWTGTTTETNNPFTFTIYEDRSYKAISKLKLYKINFYDDNADIGKSGKENETTYSKNVVYCNALPDSNIPVKEFKITYVTQHDVVTPQFEIAAYTFKGYYTERNGGGTQIYDEHGKSKLTKWEYLEDKNVYAYWDNASAKKVLPTVDDIGDSTYQVKFNNLTNEMIIKSIGLDESFDGNKVIGNVEYKKVGNVIIATIKQEFNSWSSSKENENRVESLTYIPTQSVTLTANLTDNGFQLIHVEKDKTNFIGWFTKEQSLNTLIDNVYIGGGNSSSITDNTYTYTGGGTDYNYQTIIKNKLGESYVTKENNILTINLYPWLNQFPSEKDSLTGDDVFVYKKMDDEGNVIETKKYDIVAYEGQPISDTQLLALVNVNDYEDDYLQAINNEIPVEDKRIRQINAENMKLAIKSIEYKFDGTKTPKQDADVSDLDTTYDNIGEFVITYEVEDDGIAQISDVNTNGKIKFEFTKNGYIAFNNSPYLEVNTRYFSGRTIFNNLSKDDFEISVLSAQKSIDIEDSMIFLPWWINQTYADLEDDTQKSNYTLYNNIDNIKNNADYKVKENTYQNLVDSKQIKKIYNLTFSNNYTMNKIDKVKQYQEDIKTIENLFDLKVSDNEAFNNIISFNVLVSLEDQFGKTNTSNVTSYSYDTNNSILEKHENNLQGQPISIIIDEDSPTIYTSEMRYISEETKDDVSNNHGIWGDSYYSNLLNETFDKKKDSNANAKDESTGTINDNVNITIKNY